MGVGNQGWAACYWGRDPNLRWGRLSRVWSDRPSDLPGGLQGKSLTPRVKRVQYLICINLIVFGYDGAEGGPP